MEHRHRFGGPAGLILACGVAACGGRGTPPPPPGPATSTQGGEAPPPPASTLLRAPATAAREVPADALFPTALRDGLIDLHVSPDGRLVAMAGSDGSVTLVDAANGLVRASRRLRVRGEGGLELAFRDSGRTLLVGTLGWDDPTDDVLAWDLERDEVRTILSADRSEGEARGVAFSPNGAFVAFAIKPPMREGDARERPSVVHVHDTRDGHLVDTRTVDPNPRVLLLTDEGSPRFAGTSVVGPAYAPPRSSDGRRVVSTDADEGTSVLDSTTGEALARLAGRRLPSGPIRLSPNGSCLAAIDSRGDLLVVPVPGDTPLRTGRGPDAAAVLAVEDDCASVLVLTRGGGLVRRYGARLAQRETEAVDGTVTHLQDPEPGAAVLAAISPDGTIAAIGLGSHLSIVDRARHVATAYVDENGSERSVWQARFEGAPERLAVRGRSWGTRVSSTSAEPTEAADVDAGDDDESGRSAYVSANRSPEGSAVLLVTLQGMERSLPLPDVDAHECSSEELSLGSCPGVQAILSPDDRHVAVLDRRRSLRVVTLPSEGNEGTISAPIADVRHVVFSDDGSSLWLRRADGSLAYLRQGSSPSVVIDASAPIGSTTFDDETENVRWLAVLVAGEVRVYDARSGSERGRLAVPDGSTSLSMDASGHARITYAEPARTLVFDAASGRSATVEGNVVGVASGLGAIASCASGRLFFVVDPTASTPRFLDGGGCSPSTFVSYRSDAAVAVVQEATTVDLVRMDGSARARLRFHQDEGHVTVVAVDPEGRHLVMPAHARDFTVRAPAARLSDAVLSEPDPARVRADLLAPFFTP